MAEPRDLLTGEPVFARSAYRQIADRIREQIDAGIFPEGSRLPTEGILAHEMQVSRVTVNRAVAILVEEGLVEVRRGVGVFVKARERVPEDQLVGLVRQAVQDGWSVLLRHPDGSTRHIVVVQEAA